jgi:cell division GTPase FtsZ
MNENDNDFDFIDHYGSEVAVGGADLLPENEAASAINVGIVGIGGGGGKMAKAFLDLGFCKTILVNTTEKDQPDDVDPKHLVLIPGADGVAKDVEYGKKVFQDNGAVVEDALRTKLGNVDWLFVLAGGGGGTGSSTGALVPVFDRYLKSIQAEGSVLYVASIPTGQEALNDTIKENANTLLNDLSELPHVAISNEKQLQLLRGKTGMLNMYPLANKSFAKLFWQILKLADEKSSIQSFDSKDLSRALKTKGRVFVGSTIVKDPNIPNLGATIFQNCLKHSPCPPPRNKAASGTMLLVATEEMVSDPEISKHLESAISYVGGRTGTLFSGVYVKPGIPGLVAILSMNGLDWE